MKKNKIIKYILISVGSLVGIALIVLATIFFKNFLDKKFKPNLTITSSEESVNSLNESVDNKIQDNPTKNQPQKNNSEITETQSPQASTPKEEELFLYQKLLKGYSLKNDFVIPEFKHATYYDSNTGSSMPYRLFLPDNYNAKNKYPVLLFLHGAGELGTDNTSHMPNFLQSFEVAGDILRQAIIICPQSNYWWYLDVGGYEDGELAIAKRLVDSIVEKYNGDTNRIYVTGLSMGGFGTWQMIERYENYFAAAVPVCGWGNTSAGATFAKVPIWIYHGTDDPTVNFYSSAELYNEIIRNGGKMVQFTKLEGVGHDAWNHSYSDRKMFCWMFSQNRKTHQSNSYTYFPYFKVVAPNGQTIITDDDLSAAYKVSTTTKDYIEAYLLKDSWEKLFDSYKNNIGKTYTVYCCSEKLYEYTITKNKSDEYALIENRSFLVENAVGEQDFKSLQTIFTKTKKDY